MMSPLLTVSQDFLSIFPSRPARVGCSDGVNGDRYSCDYRIIHLDVPPQLPHVRLVTDGMSRLDLNSSPCTTALRGTFISARCIMHLQSLKTRKTADNFGCSVGCFVS